MTTWNRQEVLRLVATLGAAMLLAGYFRYFLQGELLLLAKILLIAGAVFVLAAGAFGYRDLFGFFRKPTARQGSNTFVLIIAVVAILGLINYLGYRHHKRVDLTSEKLFSLSDQTKKIVGGLTQDVDVINFNKTPDADLKDRMAEYSNLSGHFHFRQVDPQEKPELARQYDVKRVGQTVVTAGSHKETLQDTTEQDITNAVVKVTRTKEKMLCFVEGHGEKSITATDNDGYSGIDTSLKHEGYQTKSINLVSAGAIPPECDVVIDPGPKQGLFPQEGSMLEKYLDDGGKALLMVDPEMDPNLDAVMGPWNIEIGKNIVVDASGVGRMFGTGPAVPLVVDYGVSPITKGFNGNMSFFPLARTVSMADKNKTTPDDVELLKTSSRSFTIPNLKTKEVKYDPKTDTLGPLSLAVVGERKNPADASKFSRLITVGDSDFATNQWASLQRNGDLFMNMVNWLAEDENLISIRPKNPTNRKVTFTETQQRLLTWFSMLLLPGIVIIVGVYIWWKRR